MGLVVHILVGAPLLLVTTKDGKVDLASTYMVLHISPVAIAMIVRHGLKLMDL